MVVVVVVDDSKQAEASRRLPRSPERAQPTPTYLWTKAVQVAVFVRWVGRGRRRVQRVEWKISSLGASSKHGESVGRIMYERHV